MEYALRAEDPADLADLPDDPRVACVASWRDLLPAGAWRALYFGSEFCEERLPGAEAAADFCRLAEGRAWAPALLTPPVTASGLARVEQLLRALAGDGHRPAVIFNDWGVLRLLGASFPRHPRRAGRLLNRSLRDPRASSSDSAAGGGSSERGSRFRAFLGRCGAEALETDPDREGAYLGDGREGLQRVLHLPFTFVTSGRHCLFKEAAEESREDRGFGSNLGKPCRRPCRGGPRAVRREDTPVPLWRAGNAIFYEASAGATRAHLAQADRVVLHRRPAP